MLIDICEIWMCRLIDVNVYGDIDVTVYVTVCYCICYCMLLYMLLYVTVYVNTDVI